MTRSKQHNSMRTRRAFSLIETVISLSIVSVLFLGLSGAVMVGSNAIPSAEELGTADRAVIDALSLLRRDLRLASSIERRDAVAGTQITITLIDTGVPGQPKQVVYQYVEANKNLTRSADGATEEILIENITYFANTFTEEGSNAIAAFMLISSDATIQPTFEFNAVLPAKPEYR